MTARAAAVAMRAFRVAGLCCNWGSPRPQAWKELGEASLPLGNIAPARSKVVFASLSGAPHFCVADKLSTVDPFHESNEVGCGNIAARVGAAVFAEQALFHEQVDIFTQHLSTDPQPFRQLGLPDRGILDDDADDFQNTSTPENGERGLVARRGLDRVQPGEAPVADRPDLVGALEHLDMVRRRAAIRLQFSPDCGEPDSGNASDQGQQLFTKRMRSNGRKWRAKCDRQQKLNAPGAWPPRHATSET